MEFFETERNGLLDCGPLKEKNILEYSNWNPFPPKAPFHSNHSTAFLPPIH